MGAEGYIRYPFKSLVRVGYSVSAKHHMFNYESNIIEAANHVKQLKPTITDSHQNSL